MLTLRRGSRNAVPSACAVATVNKTIHSAGAPLSFVLFKTKSSVLVADASMAQASRPSLPMQLALAGASNCLALAVSNPVDVLKVLLQISGEGLPPGAPRPTVAATLRGLLATDGLRGLYRGLSPSLLREASYSALRLGLYEPVKSHLTASLAGAPGAASLSLLLPFLSGALSGCVAAALTTPADLVKIRFQAQAKAALVGGKSASAPTLLGTFRHVYATEGGLPGLWQGTTPNVIRAALLTASQVGSYDTAKKAIREASAFSGGVLAREGLPLHAAASMVAGFVCAVVTSPVDVAKTRLMNQRARLAAMAAASAAATGSGGGAAATASNTALVYSGTIDCLLKTARHEGLRGVYAGFWTQWLRLGPHTIVSFIAYEKLRALLGMKPM